MSPTDDLPRISVALLGPGAWDVGGSSGGGSTHIRERRGAGGRMLGIYAMFLAYSKYLLPRSLAE